MRIKKSIFNHIIQEELTNVLTEGFPRPSAQQKRERFGKTYRKQWKMLGRYASKLASHKNIDVKKIWKNGPLDWNIAQKMTDDLIKDLKSDVTSKDAFKRAKITIQSLARKEQQRKHARLKQTKQPPPKKPTRVAKEPKVYKRGEALSLNEWNRIVQGKKVLVDFWEGWCTPCKTLWPYLFAAAGEAGVDIIKVIPSQTPLPDRTFKHPARALGIKGWSGPNFDRGLPLIILLSNGKPVAELQGKDLPDKKEGWKQYLHNFLAKA